jgi:hypothetical protein
VTDLGAGDAEKFAVGQHENLAHVLLFASNPLPSQRLITANTRPNLPRRGRTGGLFAGHLRWRHLAADWPLLHS